MIDEFINGDIIVWSDIKIIIVYFDCFLVGCGYFFNYGYFGMEVMFKIINVNYVNDNCIVIIGVELLFGKEYGIIFLGFFFCILEGDVIKFYEIFFKMVEWYKFFFIVCDLGSKR